MRWDPEHWLFPDEPTRFRPDQPRTSDAPREPHHTCDVVAASSVALLREAEFDTSAGPASTTVPEGGRPHVCK